MSPQADGIVSNGTGSAVRSDINNQYAALWSNHSGSTEPSTGKVAFQFWADTNTNILKIRNSANNSWISLFTLAGGIDVDAASNFNEDVTFTGASSQVVWDKSADDLIFNDNAKSVFGTGGDFEIFHDSSNSHIKDTGTGHLVISGSAIKLENAAQSETLATFTENGAFEGYFDNSKKISTSSDGLDVTGDVTITNTGSNPQLALIAAANGTAEIQFGDASDSVRANIIYACGTAGDKLQFNGYNNTERFNIDSSGNLNIPNDTGKIQLGASADFQLTHDGSRNLIYADIASQYVFKAQNDGNSSNRYGIVIECGEDNASGTNYALSINDGNGGGQGNITFSGGTVTYGTFTAQHPCIVPNTDNPSDNSNAYPYGTLLETISIEYTQKNGANTERGIRYKVQKTQSANSKKVLGAYGSSMNGGPDGQTNEHQALILGDGHILCNNAGGNIEVGDGICSSSTAGIGQKATVNPSMIIGIAQEEITFTGSETKLVAVQYGLQQFIPWT